MPMFGIYMQKNYISYLQILLLGNNSNCTLFMHYDLLIQALLNLPNLRMLYFHGNSIGSLSQVNKLSQLSLLRTLTLHGNPIEVEPGYKQHVLSVLPHLQTFDFSGITKSDRATADTWSKLNVTRVKVKKKSDD